MNTNTANNSYTEMRSEKRKSASKYSSVEFFIKELSIGYHCKVRDISPKGICIVVKEESPVLNHINVGDQLEMKYYYDQKEAGVELRHTEIKYISKHDEGKFKGHALIGLSIL